MVSKVLQKGAGMVDITGFLRSLCFGGLLGSGLAGLIFLLYPSFFAGAVTFNMFVTFGGLLGASIHRLINTVVKSVLHPLIGFIDTYWKMGQLKILEHLGAVKPQHKEEIQEEIIDKHFGRKKQQRVNPPVDSLPLQLPTAHIYPHLSGGAAKQVIQADRQ